jgi:hypothetical protein
MEPSLLDKNSPSPEHGLEVRTRVLEVKVGVQEQKIDDGFAALRELIENKIDLLRAEEGRARAELEMRLTGKIQETADRLERKMYAQFRLLLRLHVTTIALVLGLAAKMFWP